MVNKYEGTRGVQVVYNRPPLVILAAMFTHMIYHIVSSRISCYPTQCAHVLLLDAS
jgi:hypothetical protein